MLVCVRERSLNSSHSSQSVTGILILEFSVDFSIHKVLEKSGWCVCVCVSMLLKATDLTGPHFQHVSDSQNGKLSLTTKPCEGSQAYLAWLPNMTSPHREVRMGKCNHYAEVPKQLPHTWSPTPQPHPSVPFPH